MTDHVECRSDSHYPERPVALYMAGVRLTIEKILARWRTPEGRHFRVLAEGQQCFVLVYNEAEDQWVIDPE